MSIYSQRAIDDAQRFNCAILKYISENDLGLTHSHQYGFYLPKDVWRFFTPQQPQHGINYDHFVTVTWPDGIQTQSCIKWYGIGSRYEYRLTRFGKNFPWRQPEFVGSLFVLIPENIQNFRAYILDTDEDIEEIQTALGIEMFQSWSVYPDQGLTDDLSEDICVNRLFRQWVLNLSEMPSVQQFSDISRSTLRNCIPNFQQKLCDERFLITLEKEFHLYKMAERKFFQNQTQRLFTDIDDFIITANSILQARKARAGKSFENQIASLFVEYGIQFVSQPYIDRTRPDFVIPSIQQYYDDMFPQEKKFVVCLKRTCKDRWRQVLNEAPKIPIKHIITIQEGITLDQLNEMNDSRVKLIVPLELHNRYPKNLPFNIFGLDEFFQHVRRTQLS